MRAMPLPQARLYPSSANRLASKPRMCSYRWQSTYHTALFQEMNEKGTKQMNAREYTDEAYLYSSLMVENRENELPSLDSMSTHR